jgi:hypothetical protein
MLLLLDGSYVHFYGGTFFVFLGVKRLYQAAIIAGAKWLGTALSGVRSFLKFLDPKSGILKTVMDFLTRKVKNQALEITGLILSTAGVVGSAGVKILTPDLYYNNLIDGLEHESDSQLYADCLRFYSAAEC